MINPENISVLAEKSVALLERLNFDPSQDNPFELDNPEVLLKSGLFTDEAIRCIFNGEVVASTPADAQIASTIGMALIRPDMTQISAQVETFIADHFQLLEVATKTVNADMYWGMYSDAILSRETTQSRLTRAAVYIGSPCRLFIFERPEAKEDGVPAADYMFTNLKGRQGIRQEGTLRGDLVYNEAIRTGLHNLTDPEVALAADPFGAYRKIVQEDRGSPCHTLVHPLLFFTGVGIHVPDHQEIQRDLTLLNQ